MTIPNDTRYPELQRLLDEANHVYLKHRTMCWQGASLISNALAEYIGATIVGYFHWRDGESTDKTTITRAWFWERGSELSSHDDTEMIVGIAAHVETQRAFNTVGFRLSLRPSGDNVVASVFDNKEVLLVYRENGVHFSDDAEKEKFISFLFNEIESTVSTPAHQALDEERTKFGFHTKDKEG